MVVGVLPEEDSAGGQGGHCDAHVSEGVDAFLPDGVAGEVEVKFSDRLE